MEPEHTSQNKVGDEKTSRKKTKHIVMIAIPFIFLSALFVSFFLGFLYVGIKNPNQSVVIYRSVCSKDANIDKINNYLSEITNGDLTKTKEAIKYIKSQADYSSDPTCVEALAKFYFIDRDIRNLETQISEMKSLAGRGLYPSNYFDGLSSIKNDTINYNGLTGGSK